MTASVRLVLARHGESLWNVEERYQGQADSGLTQRGRDQADQLAGWLSASVGAADRVYSSDLPRAHDTAKPYLARTGLTATLDPRLREIDTGSWTGHTFTEIAALHGDEVRAAAAGRDVRRGGGETFTELRERARASLRDIVEELSVDGTARTAVVFSHGGTIRVAAAAALALAPPGHPLLAPPTNCSVTILDERDGATRLVQYNTPTAFASAPARTE